AEGLGRRIPDEAWRHRYAPPLRPAVDEREGEDARALPGHRPGVPVAYEGLVVDPAAALPRRRGGKAGAVDIDAPHVAVGPDRHLIARGREQIAADAGGEGGELLRRPARRRDPPELVAARGVAQK